MSKISVELKKDEPIKSSDEIADMIARLVIMRGRIYRTYDSLLKTRIKVMKLTEGVNERVAKALGTFYAHVECLDPDTLDFRGLIDPNYSYVTEGYLTRTYYDVGVALENARAELSNLEAAFNSFDEEYQNCLKSFYQAACNISFFIITKLKNVSYDSILDYYSKQIPSDYNLEHALRRTCDHFVFYDSNLMGVYSLAETVYQHFIDFASKMESLSGIISDRETIDNAYNGLEDEYKNYLSTLQKYCIKYFSSESDFFNKVLAKISNLGYTIELPSLKRNFGIY